MILQYLFLVKKKGSKFVVCARAGGANTTSSLAAHFAKRNTKNCVGEKRNGESEGGQKFLPPNPLPFCPSELKSFLKFGIRIFVKKGSDFNQKAPPIFKIRFLGDCCLAPPEAGLGFGKDFERIFEIAKQFLPAQTEVRFSEGKHKFEKFINQSFSFAFGERQSDNLILTAK